MVQVVAFAIAMEHQGGGKKGLTGIDLSSFVHLSVDLLHGWHVQDPQCEGREFWWRFYSLAALRIFLLFEQIEQPFALCIVRKAFGPSKYTEQKGFEYL